MSYYVVSGCTRMQSGNKKITPYYITDVIMPSYCIIPDTKAN